MLRLIRRIFVVVLLLGTTLVVAIGVSSRSVPDWYEPPPASDETVARLADRVEYRLLEEAQRIRPVEELWTLRVRADQVNAWLASRLPDWIAHEQHMRWPAQLGTPQVRFEQERIEVAMPVGDGAYRRVFVAVLAPAIRDGTLQVELTGLKVGRLAIPGDPLATMLAMIRQAAPEDFGDGTAWQPIVDVLAGNEPIDPVLTLSDDRRVELVAVRCLDTGIELTSRTHGIRPDDPRWGRQGSAISRQPSGEDRHQPSASRHEPGGDVPDPPRQP